MASDTSRTGIYFTDVSCVGKDFCVLVGHEYEKEERGDQMTRFLSLEGGEWGWINVRGIAHAVRFAGSTKGKREYFGLHRDRALYRIRPPKSVSLEIITKEREGFLMDLRRVGSEWYSVGGHHQAHRRIGGSWEPFDDGIYIPGEEGQAKVLLSIDGTSANDIYTCGLSGVVLHFDGDRWTRLDVPTNVGLQRVLCLDDGSVLLCGYAGQVLHGRGGYWTEISTPSQEMKFWDMAVYRNRVFVCAKKQLFTIVDDALTPVDIDVEGPLAFYRMDADEHSLWTCGNQCVLQFDDQGGWRRHRFPEN